MRAFITTLVLTGSVVSLALVGVDEPPPVPPPTIVEEQVIPAHAAACYELGY